MKYIGIVFSSIWRLWFFLVFLTVFIVLIPPLFFYTRIIPNQKIVCNITRLWSRLTLFFSGVFYGCFAASFTFPTSLAHMRGQARSFSTPSLGVPSDCVFLPSDRKLAFLPKFRAGSASLIVFKEINVTHR